MVAVILGAVACSENDTRTDTALMEMASTYGQTVEFVGGPFDETDSIAPEAAETGLVGEVRATIRQGRVRIRRYDRADQRESAETALPAQGERSDSGFTAHAGCQEILFEFRGYDTAETAVRHALLALQMLEFSNDGVCTSDPTPAATPPSTAEVFTLAVSATPAGPSSIAVQGNTNLPDGSKITLLASRALRLRGEADTRSTRVGGGATTVAGGTFSTTLSMEDDDLLFMADPIQPVEALSSDVLVCAQFRTGEGEDGPIQQAAVAEVVGDRGQRLESSPDKQVRGSALPEAEQEIWLEASATVSQPPSATDAMTAQQGVAPATETTLVPFCLA